MSADANPNAGRHWKDGLQRTGIPLEQSVKATMRSLGMDNAAEVSFERLNEEERTIVSSVDVLAEYNKEPFDVRFLIECKYKSAGTKWLFAPEPRLVYKRAQSRDVHNIVPTLHPNFVIENKDLATESTHPRVGMGVEIKPKKREATNQGAEAEVFESSIRTAVFQLRYGMYHLFLTYLANMGDEVYYDAQSIPVFVPIIVTTAELVVLREDVGHVEVAHAAEVEDVAQVEKLVLIENEPDRLVRNEFHAKVNALPQGVRDRLESGCETWGKTKLQRLVDDFSKRPKFFYVVNPEGLGQLITDLRQSFAAVPYLDKYDEPDVPGSDDEE